MRTSALTSNNTSRATLLELIINIQKVKHAIELSAI